MSTVAAERRSIMTATTLTLEPAVSVTTSGRVYDSATGRCAIDVAPESLLLAVWRARLRPLTVRFVEIGDGFEIVAHVSARAVYASLPFTTGLFMSDTPRDRILAFRCAVRRSTVGEASAAEASLSDGVRTWPAETTVRLLEWDDTHVVMSVRGRIARRGDLPLPNVAVRIDAALELVRCD
jgi:hypothetical protein